MTWPCRSCTGDTVIDTLMRVPSLRIRTTSRCRPARRDGCDQDLRHLLASFRRHDQDDRLADGLVRRIAEQALRALAPRGDAAIQRLLHDRVVGRGDNRRQQRLRFNLVFEREVGRESRCCC